MEFDEKEIGKLVGLIEPNVNFGKLELEFELKLELEPSKPTAKPVVTEVDLNTIRTKKQKKGLF